MPTNANVFNSRITSEALEKKFRDVFPAQGGAELIQDLYASGTIQPVVDFSTVAEGSVLPPQLQTAWDFSTGYTSVNNTTTTLVNTTGFWKVDLTWFNDNSNDIARIYITDLLTIKNVWVADPQTSGTFDAITTGSNEFVVFLRAGDTLVGQTGAATVTLDVWYRQIADVNGNLVNPLGFTFS